MSKKISLTFFLFFIIMTLGLKSFAHIEDSIEFMDIQVELLENGDAIILEHWTTNSIEIPEFCRTMKNIDINMFEELTIKEDENNIDFAISSDWNTLTLDQKQYKFSLLEEPNCVKLCFVGSKPRFSFLYFKIYDKIFYRKLFK